MTARIDRKADIDPRDPRAAEAGGSELGHWVRCWQHGIDPEIAFRRIFDLCYRRVFGFFASRGSSEDVCEDLTQEVFLRVHGGLSDFRGEARFETWLFQVCLNTYRQAIRNASRSKRQGRELSLETAGDGEPFDRLAEYLIDSSTPSPLEGMLRSERRAALSQAIDTLPERLRQCLLLRLDRELDHRQIARVLGLTADSVKTYQYQARRRLNEVLRARFASLEPVLAKEDDP